MKSISEETLNSLKEYVLGDINMAFSKSIFGRIKELEGVKTKPKKK